MNMREYLSRVARQMQEASLQSLPGAAQWPAERQRRLAQYYDMMGVSEYMALTERPPLNVRITSETQREGYRIQTLAYESLPQLYVTANLYIPDNLSAPAPGVLYLCGHSMQQKIHYQAHPRKFAQLGFVCLIVETIQRGEIEGHHHGTHQRGWFNWPSRGYTPAGVELWNGVRGLDLLESMPEVEGAKLGVTGLSGGGAGSWWVPAADERVQVAAPVCGTATFASHVAERTIDGHCDCMFPVNVHRWELADVGALIAPRPLLIASADRDGIFHIRSIREVHEATKRVYDHLGAGERLRLVETPGGHSYHERSRRAIFSWFLRHLQGKEVPEAEVGDIDERPEAQESVETLRVYRDGVPADERVTTVQEYFVVPAPPPTIDTADELQAKRTKTVDYLQAHTFSHFPSEPPPLDVEIEYERADGNANGGRFAFTSEEGWRLRGMWLPAQIGSQPAPTLVVLRSPHDVRRENAARQWTAGLHASWAQVYVEPRGTGDTGWSPSLDWHLRRAAMLTGRTIASMQVYDALRALKAVAELPGIDGSRLAIAGQGGMAAVALYAALLHGSLEAVCLGDPPATQDGGSNPDGTGEAIEMLFSLRVTDIPQVAGLLWPTELVFVGPRPTTYQWAEDVYARLGAPGTVCRIMQWSQWQPSA
ncbi:MAG: hypothetical protein CL878_11905 [Dehalococcoidia bacterium]|nr:hypothetical protein [Dehalococcoidia bacterium]